MTSPAGTIGAVPASLLAVGEPPPFALEAADAAGPFLVVCEHGGARLPRALGDLGLPAEALSRHYMVDINALALARGVARVLEAPLVHQRYSRMVCDCNRPLDAPDLIPETGEGTPVPGNHALGPGDREARIAAIWRPFHEGLAAVIDARLAAGRLTVLLTIHTFTPVFFGVARPWHAGVLFDRDTAFAPALLDALERTTPGPVAANEPYPLTRTGDYTVPAHGEDRGLAAALVEVRNDLLNTPADQDAWAHRLAAAAREALPAVAR